MMREFSNYEALSDQYLLKKNQIYVFGTIETGMAARVIPQMHYIEQKMIEEGLPEDERILTMLINSPGGSVSDGLAIYDTMNYIKCDVSTICIGMAASMGAFLLAAGTKGKRIALPNSEIMIHQPLGGAKGQATDIKIQADLILRTRDNLNRILSENTGRPIEEIARDTERDNFMTAKQALEYGLIDKIFEKRA